MGLKACSHTTKVEGAQYCWQLAVDKAKVCLRWCCAGNGLNSVSLQAAVEAKLAAD